MVYKLKTNPNNTWNIDCGDTKMKLMFVEEVIIHVPFETVVECHQLPDKTVYSGVIAVNYDKPLMITNGKVIFD
jgi:hypothetical protein